MSRPADADRLADRRGRSPSSTLSFLGAAGTVTGSRFLVESGGLRILVDCGLFQGLKDLRLRNWSPFPVEPSTIDAVLITHAHLDHSGYLPALARAGFVGPVLATAATRDLAAILLPDSGRLQEEEAEYAARKGYSRHRPPKPLYTEADARRSLTLFRTVEVGESLELGPGTTARFPEAGHILGSCQIELSVASGARVWFTGDLGRGNHPLLPPPAPPGDVDVMLLESTYGDRLHEPRQIGVDRLAEVIHAADRRGGVTIIPAFAVDRTELLLTELRRLRRSGALSDIPVYVDSPMALDALRVYRGALRAGSSTTSEDPFDVGYMHEVRAPEESKRLHGLRRGIIISASGMATGGRVLHHLARRLPDSRNAVVLIGYQAAGTRGRSLADGAEHVKIHGEYVPVRAQVATVNGFSTHVDRDEMLEWLGRAPREPRVAYVVHGEPHAAAGLREAISSKLGWSAVVPKHGERVLLTRR